VMKVAHIQCIERLEGVGVHHTVRLNLLFNDRQKRLGFRIGDDGRVDLSTPLYKPKHGNLACCTSTSLAFTNTAKVALIGFHFSGEFIDGQTVGNYSFLSRM